MITQRKGRAVEIPVYLSDRSVTASELSLKDLPAEMQDSIREMHVLDHRWNWIVAFIFVLWLIGATVAVSTSFLPIRLPALILAGLALSTMPVLTHESSHLLFHRRSISNHILGFLCGLPVMFSSGSYRIVHAHHHKYLRTAMDPDDIENVTTRGPLLRFIFPALFFLGAYPYLVLVPFHAIRLGDLRQRIAVVAEVILMVTILVAAWNLLPADWMIVGWLLPLVIAGQIVNARGISEHGLTAPGRNLLGTRTITSTRWLSFMMCHINLHIEHHLFPGVPWYRLPKLHALLRGRELAAHASVYDGYGSFYSDLIKVLIRGPRCGSLLLPESLRP
jgi:fatty acid desaturase